MEKLEEAEKPASGPAVERPYSLPGTFGGTEVIEEECRVIRSRLKLITLLHGLLNKSTEISGARAITLAVHVPQLEPVSNALGVVIEERIR